MKKGSSQSIQKEILLDIAMHLAVTLALSFLVQARWQNFAYASMVFAGGVLVDLDHLFDHFMVFGPRFVLRDFLRARFLESGKFYVILHSWEILFVLTAIGLANRSLPMILFCLSFALHLAIDNVKKKNPLVYLLVYRIAKGFDLKTLLPEKTHFLPSRETIPDL